MNVKAVLPLALLASLLVSDADLPGPAGVPPSGGGTYSDSGPGYAVMIDYPPVAHDVAEIGDTLKAYADQLIATMRQGLVERADTDLIPHEIDASFRHEPSPSGMVCLMAYVYAYGGGAHGMTWSRSWVYDTRCNSFIDPIALLGDSAAFASFAEQVRDSLLVSIDSDSAYITEGTAPEPSNYRALLPLPDSTGAIGGFLVNFSPYQVAPYAYGSFEVVVRR